MYICIFCSISLPIYTYTLKYDLFIKNSKTKILIFEYFPKIPSEMNSTHPFYPIPYTQKMISKNNFNFRTGCSKSAVRGGKLN